MHSQALSHSRDFAAKNYYMRATRAKSLDNRCTVWYLGSAVRRSDTLFRQCFCAITNISEEGVKNHIRAACGSWSFVVMETDTAHFVPRTTFYAPEIQRQERK